jgi:hypothetical protein
VSVPTGTVGQIVPPVWPVAPVPPAAPSASTPLAKGQRHMELDAFYADERKLSVPRSDHPIRSYYNVHTKADASGYEHASWETMRRKQPNPLNDPALSTVLPQTFAQVKPSVKATQAIFDEPGKYWLYAPPKLKAWYDAASDKKELTARVAVFFGVGPEPNLFGLRQFFAETGVCVLVGVNGVESGWKNVPKAWGVGVSTKIIRTLLDDAGLKDLPFQVEVMAGYSTGYRGLNLTAINKLVDLSKLRRFIYLDAFYWHDDHPQPAETHPFHKKLSVWAADTVFKASAAAEVFIVGYTHPGATPRDAKNNPKGPLKEIDALRPGSTYFLDLEFKRDGVDPIADDLEKVCLARLLQGGVGDYFELTSLPMKMQKLIALLPDRGSLGIAQVPGYRYFRTWRLDPAVKLALAAFPTMSALALVDHFKLLDGWTTSARIEFRHRDFVQEIGKELLLP